MTAPEAAKAARNYLLPLFLGVLTIGIAVNFALLIPALKTQGEQAREGQKAKTRQTAVYPVALKVYADAHARGVITDDDFECFRTGHRCPPPSATP